MFNKKIRKNIIIQESNNTILFPLFALALFTLFVGAIGIPFNQERMDFDILSKWLNPATNLLHKNLNNYGDWYEFVINAIFSVSISYSGLYKRDAKNIPK